MSTITKSQFVKKFLLELNEGNAAIFAGAGLSVPAGFVDWPKLVKPLADEIGLDSARETDLVSLTQYFVNQNDGNRHTLHDAIVTSFPSSKNPTTNHKILAKLPISTYWTTNYDRLIENALRNNKKVVDVKSAVPQLAITQPRRDAVVYKMHGDVERPDEAVATRNDYETYPSTRGAFINALAGDLVSKTFLFLGFSFSDPNLDHVLSRVRITFKNNQRRHYAIFKKRSRLEGESDEDFQYAQIRQGLVLADLKRFNITSILVDDYAEITEILKDIERLYRQQTIFVSASASSFEPWGEQAVTSFMRKLGSALVSAKFRVATGLGLGVGNALFTGILEQCAKEEGVYLEDRALLRPFPQHIADQAEREKVWEAYRREIISQAGISIFLFGNKIVDGKTVVADGMLREFAIANELGSTCIPIGSTGGAALCIYRQNGLNLPTSIEMDETINNLLHENCDNLDSLIEPILNICKACIQ